MRICLGVDMQTIILYYLISRVEKKKISREKDGETSLFHNLSIPEPRGPKLLW